MRGLHLRLAVNVAVVALIGLLIVDVAFIFWAQTQLGRERHLELRVAALEAAAQLTGLTGFIGPTGSVGDPRAVLVAMALEHEVELTVMGRDGTQIGTTESPLDLAGIQGIQGIQWRGRTIVTGFEHVSIELPPGGTWSRVVASRRLETTVSKVLALQRPTLFFLAGVLALMVFTGLVFLRRVVVMPIGRMTELVDRSDQEALSRFGLGSADDFGRLSQAIIAMTQRIDDDRKRIAWQLEELRATHNDLSSTQQQLVRAERLAVVGQLAAGLAHEIGNPLAVLSGYVEVLRDPKLPDEERTDSLRRMARELDRISATVRDLLDFSRASSPADEQGNLGDVISHVRKLLEPQDSMQAIHFELGEVDSAATVPIDSGALTQVLLNLTLNAAYALDGKGTIRVAAGADDSHVTLSVEDSGPGVPEDLRSRIFEPFFTTKPAGQGTGLGLAVCDHIISSAGGEITIGESELGGAAFVITLPVSESRAQ